jgi:hypothetical protein
MISVGAMPSSRLKAANRDEGIAPTTVDRIYNKAIIDCQIRLYFFRLACQ